VHGWAIDAAVNCVIVFVVGAIIGIILLKLRNENQPFAFGLILQLLVGLLFMG
jgi:F0F1-type ATP synthase assembly protein I